MMKKFFSHSSFSIRHFLFSIFYSLFSLFFLLTAHTSLLTDLSAADSKKTVAIVISFKGKLSVKSKGESKFLPAKKGQFLYEGDVVRTGKNSLAALTFASGVQLKVNEDTEFTITEKQIGKVDEELSMKRGQIYSKVLKRGSQFGIRTVVALAAVRGTEYDVDLQGEGNNASERVSVLDGTVQVGNDYGSVNVNAGQYSSVSPGEAPQPPQEMGAGDQPSWQNNIQISNADQSQGMQTLQTSSATVTTAVTSEEKTLEMEVDTGSGKKMLRMKFKK